MTDQIPSELYEKFFEFAKKGDEAGARKFLIENLKQFPQETQDVIITAFLEEALAKKAQGDSAISEFQKRGMETMEALKKAKEELERKGKMAQIKESL